MRARAERIVDFILREDLDILAMQEIKCKPDQFPTEIFNNAGYQTIAHGIDQWNGVGFATRLEEFSTINDFPNQPRYGNPGKEPKLEARCMHFNFQDLKFYSLYIPNGRSLEHPHYQYKLTWLKQLYREMKTQLDTNPEAKIMLMGDWNVAPLDTDVWDIEYWRGQTHVSEPERIAFEKFTELGFKEITREYFDGYTYWDYTRGRFPKNEGMRIDFIYCSPALQPLVKNAYAVRDERKGKGASDHIPVVVEI